MAAVTCNGTSDWVVARLLSADALSSQEQLHSTQHAVHSLVFSAEH